MLSNDMGSIRSIQPEDLPFLMKLRSDNSTWMNLGDPVFVNAASQHTWYESMSNDATKQYMIYQRNWQLHPLFDKVPIRVGMVRLDEIDHLHKSIRVGGDIAKEYRGRGHGTNMYELIKEYCFDFLNMHRIWLLVADFNKPAIELYQKVGFKEEGRYKEGFLRFGKYHDYICMSILDYKVE